MRVERLHQLGEIGERAGQPVDLVDDDDVDPALADAIEEVLQRRPLHGAAGIAAVVEALANEPPALVRLALDIGLGGFSLRVEGIEVLFKARVGGDAGVDGAANGGGHVASPARDGSLGSRDVRARGGVPLVGSFARPLVSRRGRERRSDVRSIARR